MFENNQNIFIILLNVTYVGYLFDFFSLLDQMWRLLLLVLTTY